MLRQLHGRLAAQGIALKLSGTKKQLHDALERTGLAQQLGADAFYATDHAAIEALGAKSGRRAASAD
jgi:hypothetical protein